MPQAVNSLRRFRNFTYEELCEALDYRFGAARTVVEDKRLLRTWKKGPTESYAHLAPDIRRLVRHVYQ